MTAKEMFEKLGYKLRQNDNFFIQYNNFFDDDATISFCKIDKKYTCFYGEYEEEDVDLREITIEEHKAITQQLKELGWLDE